MDYLNIATPPVKTLLVGHTYSPPPLSEFLLESFRVLGEAEAGVLVSRNEISDKVPRDPILVVMFCSPSYASKIIGLDAR